MPEREGDEGNDEYGGHAEDEGTASAPFRRARVGELPEAWDRQQRQEGGCSRQRKESKNGLSSANQRWVVFDPIGLKG